MTTNLGFDSTRNARLMQPTHTPAITVITNASLARCFVPNRWLRGCGSCSIWGLSRRLCGCRHGLLFCRWCHLGRYRRCHCACHCPCLQLGIREMPGGMLGRRHYPLCVRNTLDGLCRSKNHSGEWYTESRHTPRLGRRERTVAMSNNYPTQPESFRSVPILRKFVSKPRSRLNMDHMFL